MEDGNGKYDDIIDNLFYGETSPVKHERFKRWVFLIENLFGNVGDVVADKAFKGIKATNQSVANLLGVSVNTVSKDLKNPDFQRFKAEILKRSVHPIIADVAVRNIMKDVLKGNVNTSKWFLENIDYFGVKGKQEGEPPPAVVTINLNNVPDGELKEIFQAMKKIDDMYDSDTKELGNGTIPENGKPDK